MKVVDDFFNKLAKDLRSKYFPNEDHGRTENKKYHETTYAVECFSNGCLTYSKLINTLAKSCNDTKENIHEIVSRHVEDFQGFEYKPL